jgi:DNA-directed RNA polymerase specialized sigma24 family protein
VSGSDRDVVRDARNGDREALGQRTAVILYYRDELPVRDIAHALGVTTGTVKTLLFRARRHLRERLAGAAISHQEKCR